MDHFMADDTKTHPYTPLAADAKIEDLNDHCQACFVTGNVWTVKDAATSDVVGTCVPPSTDKSAKVTDKAEVDLNLTYE